jgi:hypothetical protein
MMENASASASRKISERSHITRALLAKVFQPDLIALRREMEFK